MPEIESVHNAAACRTKIDHRYAIGRRWAVALPACNREFSLILIELGIGDEQLI